MITAATPKEHPVAAQIYAVTQAAYALEAEWIGCADFPPMRESLENLRCSSDSFLVFRQSDVIVAALSYECCAEDVVITRLVVRPTHLRQGIATALLTDLERRFPRATRFVVSTAQANLPAVRLYEQLGYTKVGVIGSAEGIPLLQLNKFNARGGNGSV